MKKRLAVSLLFLLVIVGVWQAEHIYDWWFLRTYQPSAQVAALADEASLNDNGRRDFYLADPMVDTKQQFNQNCPVEEASLVLGCYSAGKIYILNVERPELAGVMEVTAAHEMLHAAYSELSRKERNRVNAWIEEYYAANKTADLEQLIAEYERTEPGQTLNELHSILGTQVAVLSPQLENYYNRYFIDRQKVVASYQAYEDVFKQLENQINGLSAQIETLRAEITLLEQQIDSQQTEVEALNRQLDSLLAQNQVAQYNGLVPSQNAAVAEYNALVSQYRNLITTHNAKVEQVNQLALEQNQLIDSLNSSKFTPIEN